MIVDPNPVDPETEQRTRAEFNLVRIVRPTVRKRDWKGRLRHEFDPNYLQTDAYGISADERGEVTRLVSEHDVVWLQCVRTPNRLGIERWPASVLDVDDLPSSLYRSAASISRRPWRRLMDKRMEMIWRRRERLFADRFDILAVCSHQDAGIFRDRPVEVIPNGFEAEQQAGAARSVTTPPTLGFIGNFRWSPNLDGIEWFISDVWTKVQRAVPQARLKLIGEGSEKYSSSLRSIEGLGWVENPTDEFARWAAMVVPIRFGGGTRIKIAEAFARRCPVVSTALGAFGYEVQSGTHLELADDPGDFALACARLLEDRAYGERLAAAAHELFCRAHTWSAVEEPVNSAVHRAWSRANRPTA